MRTKKKTIRTIFSYLIDLFRKKKLINKKKLKKNKIITK